MRAAVCLSILALSTGSAAADEKGGLTATATADARGEGVTGFELDRYGTEADGDLGLSPLLRLGAGYALTVRGVDLSAAYEHDLTTDPADDTELRTNLRKAYVRGRVGPVVIGAGYEPSHWGMGLVSNDGDHGWTPGSARFASQRGGDVSLRGSVSALLWRPAGLVAVLAIDRVHADDVMFDGDRAIQGIAAVVVGYGQPRTAGLYVAQRAQRNDATGDVDVTVIDATGKWTFAPSWGEVAVEGEAVAIVGETTLAPTNDFPRHDVRQFGAALRSSLRSGVVGGVIDLVYASGDDNFDDDVQRAFQIDRNFDLGFLLFRHVVAAQTARAVDVASDPDLIGMPPPDIERFATRGTATNTIAVFPRAFWQPADHLEIYGGPLLALSPERNADPFNTQIAGGAMRDALDGPASHYLGTEIDLGARYTLPTSFGDWQLGLESGALFPGVTGMDPVFGARTMVRFER